MTRATPGIQRFSIDERHYLARARKYSAPSTHSNREQMLDRLSQITATLVNY